MDKSKERLIAGMPCMPTAADGHGFGEEGADGGIEGRIINDLPPAHDRIHTLCKTWALGGICNLGDFEPSGPVDTDIIQGIAEAGLELDGLL